MSCGVLHTRPSELIRNTLSLFSIFLNFPRCYVYVLIVPYYIHYYIRYYVLFTSQYVCIPQHIALSPQERINDQLLQATSLLSSSHRTARRRTTAALHASATQAACHIILQRPTAPAATIVEHVLQLITTQRCGFVNDGHCCHFKNNKTRKQTTKTNETGSWRRCNWALQRWTCQWAPTHV